MPCSYIEELLSCAVDYSLSNKLPSAHRLRVCNSADGNVKSTVSGESSDVDVDNKPHNNKKRSPLPFVRPMTEAHVNASIRLCQGVPRSWRFKLALRSSVRKRRLNGRLHLLAIPLVRTLSAHLISGSARPRALFGIQSRCTLRAFGQPSYESNGD